MAEECVKNRLSVNKHFAIAIKIPYFYPRPTQVVHNMQPQKPGFFFYLKQTNKPSICLSIIYIFYFITFAQAQTPKPIWPVREYSMGNRAHTSRDEVVEMKQSTDGNLLLLGFVESDSMFADVSLQKVTPEGVLLWDFRYDSPDSNNYDVPLKMLLDEYGNTFILGMSLGAATYFDPQLSNGFLLKVGINGEKAWQVSFDTLLPTHTAARLYDGFIDERGSIKVTYSTYQNFGPRPSYFMKFEPGTGFLLDSFPKFNLSQAFGGGPAATSVAIDSNKNFVFTQWEDAPGPSYSIRSIDPESGEEQGTPFNLSGLDFDEKQAFSFLSWTKTVVDGKRALYTAENLENSLEDGVIAKVDSNGTVAYAFTSDSLFTEINGFVTSSNKLFVSGAYTPKSWAPRVAFLWKLDDNGQIEHKITMVLPHDCATRGLTIVRDSLFWLTEDEQTGEARLACYDTHNLSNHWSYFFDIDSSYLFTGSGAVNLADGAVAVGGTLRRMRSPLSGLFSENEYYMETFYPEQQAPLGKYRYSEKGTTRTVGVGHAVDAQGNFWVKTFEAIGPGQYPFGEECFYHKLSPDLTPIWSRRSVFYSYSAYGVSPFYFDHLGNAYVVEQQVDSLVLQKIGPDGANLNTFKHKVANFRDLFIDRKGSLHLSLLGAQDTLITIVLDTQMQVMKTMKGLSLPKGKFQLPNAEPVYYYMEQNEWGVPIEHIVLYKDGEMDRVWEFSFANTIQYFTDYSLDKNTGDLLALAVWPNLAGFYEPALYRFSIDGSYQQSVINNGVFDPIYDIALMPNGNSFVVFEARLDVYSPDFQLLTSFPLDNPPYGGYFFPVDTIFYRSMSGNLWAFGQSGIPLFSVQHASFSTNTAQIHIQSKDLLSTSSIFGEIQGTNGAFGWQWQRSKVSQFDLSAPVTQVVGPLQAGRPRIVCQPIPASTVLQVDVSNLNEESLDLVLVSALGVPVLQKQFGIQHDAILHLEVSALPSGTYFLSVHTEAGVFTQKVAVLH